MATATHSMTSTPPPAPCRLPQRLPPGLFAGQVVWVTGGGSGIGRCVAHELAALGAQVVISGRTQDKLDAWPPRSPPTAAAATLAAFDIRDEEAVKAGVAAVVKAHGRCTAWSTTPAGSSRRR
jgi:citronellol/citronellal dehydrogenase